MRDRVQQLFRGEVSILQTDIFITTSVGEHRHWSFFSASAPGTLLDGRRFIVGMALDISERRRSEEALLENSGRVAADLKATTRLVEVGNFCLRLGNEVGECLKEILDAAITLTLADRGNIQILDEETGALKIAV